MGRIKDRNNIDLTETDKVKEKWQENTKELYKKGLYDPDNLNGVIIHQECEVQWALGSITMNKASGGDGILAELFQVLRDDAVKVLHSSPHIWKTQQWPQDWKRPIVIPTQRREMPKNIQTMTEFHSFHMLAK